VTSAAQRWARWHRWRSRSSSNHLVYPSENLSHTFFLQKWEKTRLTLTSSVCRTFHGPQTIEKRLLIAISQSSDTSTLENRPPLVISSTSAVALTSEPLKSSRKKPLSLEKAPSSMVCTFHPLPLHFKASDRLFLISLGARQVKG
jgi:hypothetical protein